MKEISPKIISIKPLGKDAFKAQSHKKISSTIIELIKNQSNNIGKQIIGLEGSWGTGKSNIIKSIEEEIEPKNNYYHFTYDAWSNQEDLTKKSIIEELVIFLKSDENKGIEQIEDKEKKLYEVVIDKTTTIVSRVKPFYIIFFLLFSFVKIFNEIYKYEYNGKLYGFYENSFKYLTDYSFLNFNGFFYHLNYNYLLKLFPYIIFLIGIILFFKSFINHFKNKKDEMKLIDIILTHFYFLSGNTNKSELREIQNELNPSNSKFRHFLKVVDSYLQANKKVLIFTIDNLDRLSNKKTKSIWSIINIFFADNNKLNLENIWIIIPYDKKRIIDSHNEEKEIAEGLLEKTFEVKFNVPPILISNWEKYLREKFDEAFRDVKLKNKENELTYIVRILEAYENNITPRKIIRYINSISTYYIQNRKILLRYTALVNFLNINNIKLNERILNIRESLKPKVKGLFESDNNLEINIAKIIFGVENDNTAAEVLLYNSFESNLKENKLFNDDLLKAPAFKTYFYKFFSEKFDNTFRNLRDDNTFFENISSQLIKIKELFKPHEYSALWDRFQSVAITSERLLSFNSVIENMLLFCSYQKSNQFLESRIKMLFNEASQPGSAVNTREVEKENYIEFLKQLYDFSNKNKIDFNGFNLREFKTPARLLLDTLKTNSEYYESFKLKCSIKDLQDFLFTKSMGGVINGLEDDLLIKYKKELRQLSRYIDINSILDVFNKYWLNEKKYTQLEEIETLMFFCKEFRDLTLNNLKGESINSIVELSKETENKNVLNNLVSILIMSYKKPNITPKGEGFDIITNQLINSFKEIESFILEFNSYDSFFNLIINAVELNITDDVSDIINKIKIDELYIYDKEAKWILDKFSKLNTLLDDSNVKKLYHKITLDNLDFDFNTFDIKVLGYYKKGKVFNKIIKECNETLFQNNRLFFNVTTKDFKVYSELFRINKLDLKSNTFYQDSIVEFIASNRTANQIVIENISQLKVKLPEGSLSKIIDENINRLYNRQFVALLYPEISISLGGLRPGQLNTFNTIILNKPDFYTIEIVKYLINLSNPRITNTLRHNLKKHSNSNIKEMINLISPNP